MKITILHNIGWVYLEMNSSKRPLTYLNIYSKKKESTNNVEVYTLTLTNLGNCYLELGNLKR
jgi:hypothetical protein